MKKQIRIIPRLDVKNNTVIKGIHLEGLRVVGVPSDLAKKYYLAGADELLYMDAVASLYERNSLQDIIRRTAEEVFIPLTVGGGIRTLEDIKNILRAGADKVAINTAAIKRPEFIKEASQRFGSQCIVGSIEAKKMGESKWEAYVDTGRQSTGVDALEWAQRLVDLGAGELLITSIDCEGTKKGLDIELIKKIGDCVPIPVIACGGIGTSQHIVDLLKAADVSAVACASILHYGIAAIPSLKKDIAQTYKGAVRTSYEKEHCYY
ncbi:MAG: imidazole glycerol phosphate synthase cyclase subunit [Candidatus Omnitrophota bacterium]|nr:imidazole glycerol phosphate synthase cyclase subunit [Candidatus Omnitrophota bacterium]